MKVTFLRGTKNGTAAPTSISSKLKLSDRLSIQRSCLFDLLNQLAEDNAKFFAKTAATSSYAKRLHECCSEIIVSTNALRELISTLQDIAPRYDFDVYTPGNGFRSLICISDIVLFHLISLLRACTEKRYMLIFRSSYYCKEVEAYGAVLRFFVLSFQQVISTTNELPSNSLFPPFNDDPLKHRRLLKGIEALDASCFYGRALGFQFAPSVGRIFRFIGVILATYSLSWEKGYSPIGSLLNTGRIIISPEQRASRILKVTQEADIEFCKGFWNLSELGNQVPRFFCPNVAVNDESEIPIENPVTLETTSGGIIEISPPSVHTGKRPVRIRILSYMHRDDLKASSEVNDRLPASPYLLLHCHGGGYVATSSKSHETYLRSWAKSLDCVIVSVDYSLAPENPFPRPTEEVLYAYAYILNHPAEFGWTGEKLCMAGDSAGGNLITSVSIRLLQLGVKRRPDGLILIYTPFLFQYLPSPSRMLSFFDPLLHMGVVLRCTAAYTSGYISEDKPTTVPSSEKKRHKSLQEYVDEVQKVQSNKIFSLEDSSILSLVNLSRNGCKELKQPHEVPSQSAKEEDVEQEQRGSSSEEEEDIVEHGAPMSGIQVMSDTHRIMLHLSSSVCDHRLVDYLRDHPLTKDFLISHDEVEEDSLQFGDSSSEVNNESNLTPALVNPESKDIDPMVEESNKPSASYTPSRTLVASLSSHSLAAASRQMRNVRSFSHSLADTAVMAAGHAIDNLSGWFDTSPPIGRADKVKLNRVASLSPDVAARLQQEEAQETVKCSYIDQLTKNEVPKDPLISPMYASSDVLRQLPPLRFLACHLDPLLDDTISFAKKARDCGANVESIDLLDNLPHGFLNFTLVSPECREGAKICLQRIKESFGMTDVTCM